MLKHTKRTKGGIERPLFDYYWVILDNVQYEEISREQFKQLLALPRSKWRSFLKRFPSTKASDRTDRFYGGYHGDDTIYPFPLSNPAKELELLKAEEGAGRNLHFGTSGLFVADESVWPENFEWRVK